MHYNELEKRLMAIDEEAYLTFPEEKRMNIVIAGGSALIFQKVLSRSSNDIDALSVDNKLIDIIEKYDMNINVRTYLDFFPCDYLKRANLIYSGRKVDFYALSLEDIVISKLFSSRRTDRNDIISKEVTEKLDWEKLDKIVKSDEICFLNERIQKDYMYDYEEYVRRYKK